MELILPSTMLVEKFSVFCACMSYINRCNNQLTANLSKYDCMKYKGQFQYYLLHF